MIATLLFVVFIVMMLMGVPIGAALGLAGAACIALANADVQWWGLLAVPQNFYAGLGKYPLLAIPMFVLVGIPAEATLAAYRVGDSVANIITPLMVYFPLILIFCQRWQKDFGLGSLAATMLPFSIGLLLSGMVLVGAWVMLDLPLGPGASVFAPVPAAP